MILLFGDDINMCIYKHNQSQHGINGYGLHPLLVWILLKKKKGKKKKSNQPVGPCILNDNWKCWQHFV